MWGTGNVLPGTFAIRTDRMIDRVAGEVLEEVGRSFGL